MERRSYEAKGFKVKGRSRPSIREDAHTVVDVIRRQMSLSTPLLPIERVVEWMDSQGCFDLDLPEGGLADGKAAELQRNPGGTLTLVVNEKVYEGACMGDNFGRFTLAHELGHYFLHSRQTISLPRASLTPSHRPFEDTEWQANTFAGELLVDSRLVPKLCSSVRDVEVVFGVSRVTAEIQWKERENR